MNIEKLLKLIDEIVKNPYRVIESLLEFKTILENERRETSPKGVIVNYRDAMNIKKILVFGDIHGDLETMINLLDRTDILEDLYRDSKLVFLGDYIDRGPQQIETFIAIYILKKKYRDRVVTLRGNHEPPDYLPVHPHDYPLTLKSRYGAIADDIYRISKQIFETLPHAYIIDKTAVFLHGGIPVLRTLNCSNDFRCILDTGPHPSKVLEEILWNDPIDDDQVEYAPSPRGAGYLWGPTVTEKFLKKTGVRYIIRGHEPTWNGYKLNHSGNVITVFSRKGEPYYNAYASSLKLDLNSYEYEFIVI